MTDTLCIIEGHGKAQATFDRHLPLWLRHGFDMLIASPVNDPLKTDLPCLTPGRSSRNGPLAVERLRNILNHVSTCGYRYAMLFEYDSLCLIDRPMYRTGFRGILQVNQDLAHFMTPRYVHSPWIFSAATAQSMLKIAYQYPDMTESGVDDRYLSALAMLANIPILGHPEGGLGRNDILPEDYALMDDMILNHGVRWVHGIKSQEALDRLNRTWSLIQ
jgi:hypothetical protein